MLIALHVKDLMQEIVLDLCQVLLVFLINFGTIYLEVVKIVILLVRSVMVL